MLPSPPPLCSRSAGAICRVGDAGSSSTLHLAKTRVKLTSERPVRPRKVPDPPQKFYVSVASVARLRSALWAGHLWAQPSLLQPE